MIGGVNLEEMFQRDGQAVRVTGEKIAAPHNAFLEVGLTRGIIPLIFYAAFHVLLIVKMFKIHNAIGGSKTSSAALSIVISAFLIGMIANYFTQVSTCLSYLFYSILGLYINFERDACRQ
jgi:O-antigen ligase